MKMLRVNYQKNHARQLLGLTLATARLDRSLFAVDGYSATRPPFLLFRQNKGENKPSNYSPPACGKRVRLGSAWEGTGRSQLV